MTKYYVKVVHANISSESATYTSLCIDSGYCLTYYPGEWARPTLSGSKLFVFKNVQGAMDFLVTLDTPFRYPRELPFTGTMLWWCEAIGIEFPQQPPLKNPPDGIVRKYWSDYPYIYPTDVPKIYKPDMGAHSILYATGVKLIHTITEEEIRRLVPVD